MPTSPQDVEKVLRSSNVPDAVKKDTWDAFTQIESQSEFETKLRGLPLDDATRKSLWDLKRNRQIDPTRRGTIRAVPSTTDRAVGMIPSVGGVVGGIVGSRFGMPLRGAMVGGAVAERARQYIQSLRGKEALPPTKKAVGEMVGAGAEQGAYEAGGQLVSGAVRGPLKSLAGPEERAALKTSQEAGLNLSSAEVMKSAGRTGRLMGRLQHGAMRAGLSNPSVYRQAGEANAQRIIESGLDTFAPSAGRL